MAVIFKQADDGTSAFENTADAIADLRLGGPAVPSVTSPRYIAKRVMKVPLAALDTAGAALSWLNPFSYAIIIRAVTLDITTHSTGAGTISVGTTAVSGVTSSANLIDTLDVGTAAGTFDNVTDKGVNGKSRQKLAVGAWVTGSKASGALAGLVGYAYIEFYPAT